MGFLLCRDFPRSTSTTITMSHDMNVGGFDANGLRLPDLTVTVRQKLVIKVDFSHRRTQYSSLGCANIKIKLHKKNIFKWADFSRYSNRKTKKSWVGQKRSKAMEMVVGVPGVLSAALQGSKKEDMEVVGEGIDVVELIWLLRKKVGDARLVSVGRDGPRNLGEGSSISLSTTESTTEYVEEGRPCNEPQSLCLFHDDQIVQSESSSGGDEWIDLRFANKLCHCGHKAAVRIVESENPLKGRLYYGCTSNGCQIWEWCNPHTTKLLPYGRPLDVLYESNAAMAEVFELEENECNAAIAEVFEVEENEHAATARMNVMEAKQIEYAAMIKVLQGNQALMKLAVTVFLLFAGLCFMMSIVVILMK